MKRLLYYVGMLLGLLGVDACRNPLDDVQIQLKDALQQGILEVRLRMLQGNMPTGIRVKIAGPDADRIVTPLNTRRFRVTPEGVLLLAAAPDATPTRRQPLRFTLVLEADGFPDLVQPLTIQDAGRRSLSLPWISLTNSPTHQSVATASGRSDAGGRVASALTATTPARNQKTDNASVTIPAGTTVQTADGQPVSGALTLTVQHIENRSRPAVGLLPVGTSVLSNVTSPDGQSQGALRLNTVVGAVDVDVVNDQYALVKQFSQPAQLLMDLNPATVNPQTGRAIQPGDAIPLYSYDDQAGRWQTEKAGVVIRSGAKLQYRAELPHLSLWVAGWGESICERGPAFRVSSQLKGVDVHYLVRIVDASTRQPIGSFYTSMNDGATITTSYLPKGRTVRVQVVHQNDADAPATGNVVAESAPVESCDATVRPLDVSRLPAPAIVTVQLQFSCPQGTSLDESKLPAQLRTQYSPTGRGQWRDLVTLTRTTRSVRSSKLQLGRRYDIRASTDGGSSWPLLLPAYKLDKQDITFKIRSAEYCR